MRTSITSILIKNLGPYETKEGYFFAGGESDTDRTFTTTTTKIDSFPIVVGGVSLLMGYRSTPPSMSEQKWA